MAAKYDFAVDQGSKHTFNIQYTNSERVPKSLAGFAIRSQVRMNINDCDAIGELVCEITDSSQGMIKVTLPSSLFIGLKFKASSAESFQLVHYDIELYSLIDPDDIFRLLQGTIKVSPEVTK